MKKQCCVSYSTCCSLPLCPSNSAQMPSALISPPRVDLCGLYHLSFLAFWLSMGIHYQEGQKEVRLWEEKEFEVLLPTSPTTPSCLVAVLARANSFFYQGAPFPWLQKAPSSTKTVHSLALSSGRAITTCTVTSP